MLIFSYVLVAQYKNIHLEIDVNAKSDRVEWGHCRYQSLFRPDRAYELVVQWVAASGPIVAELVIMTFIPLGAYYFFTNIYTDLFCHR